MSAAIILCRRRRQSRHAARPADAMMHEYADSFIFASADARLFIAALMSHTR